jgi:hypothetical protein
MRIDRRIVLFILIIIIYLYFYKYNTTENFIPMINQHYRRHSRNVRLEYETFVNKYGNGFVVDKLKKWEIL